MSSQSNPLNPTFEGHIGTTLDALVLFEACLSGRLNHVPRRPHDRERQDLIRSGNVFIYEEHASGIKRWTDGVSWSPSRILGNFLIYRELDKPFPPGEKKRALKKKKCPSGGITKPEPTSRPGVGGFPAGVMDSSVGKDTERALIGSLIDSYPFKNDGLVKKTISITYQGIPHHLVSYYNVNDVMSGRLLTPARDASLRGIVPRSDLVMSQNFRSPIDEVEYGADERGVASALFASLSGSHDFTGGPNSVLHRTMSMPSFQPVQVPQYSGSQYGGPPYGFAHHPQQHYLASMGSQVPPGHMPSSLSSSMPPSMASSGPPSAQPSHAPSMPSSSGGSIGYPPQGHGNYSLDPSRTARFGSGSMSNEFPRNMPAHNSPRQSSAYELAQSSDMSSMSLGSISDHRSMSNGTSYVSQSSYYLPHRATQVASHDNHGFPSARPMKSEQDGMPEGNSGSQQYGLDENASTWNFGSLDGTNEQQYFGGQTGGGSQQWQGGSSSMGRT